MHFIATRIPDLFMVDLDRREDERGFFARAWCSHEFGEQGLEDTAVQANLVRTARKGIVRGLHYQLPPHGEAKFVRCIRGAVYDVAVDLRRSSSTFGHWFAAVLDADRGRMLYVPPGFAHGYQALTDECETFYLVSSFYTPGVERGLRWNDPRLGIKWPIPDAIVTSDKDAGWPDFESIRESDLPD